MVTVRGHERIHPAAIARNALSFTREKTSALSIRQIEPGAVRIADETFTENVLIFRDEVQRGITLDVETLTETQLDELLQQKPEIVILGTGWQAQIPPRDIVFSMARKGIGFETMDTPAACRTFNILLSEGRDVAAILIIRD